jgi:hypothetical protein
MSLKKLVLEFLRRIESETGKHFGYAVTSMATGVRKIQIFIYPVNAEASERTFDLHDGLTLKAAREIRTWIEPQISNPLSA